MENQGSGLKRSILIVEDEQGPRDSLRMILRPFYQIYEAETGENALEILQNSDIDLITLDLKLPGIRGADMLREIRKIAPDAEILVITGYRELKPEFDQMDNKEIAGFITKPFDVSELLSTLIKTLDKQDKEGSAVKVQ